LVVGVAEAKGGAADEFDDAVDAFALGVAVAGVGERFDPGPPSVDGGGELPDLGDAGVGAGPGRPIGNKPTPR
jgi:hypothetical protein